MNKFLEIFKSKSNFSLFSKKINLKNYLEKKDDSISNSEINCILNIKSKLSPKNKGKFDSNQ